MLKKFSGVVISDKMDKTGVLFIKTLRVHPLYRKKYYHRKKIKFHDEKKVCKIGDYVSIEYCRPISKHKHFRFLKILEKK